jgi:DNA invertase Pin-like site-specific DNA recombinase
MAMFLAFAEFERDMIVARTQEGKAIAKTKPGFKEGRPKEYTPEQLHHAVDLLKTHSYRQVEEKMKMSKSTLQRAKRASLK